MFNDIMRKTKLIDAKAFPLQVSIIHVLDSGVVSTTEKNSIFCNQHLNLFLMHTRAESVYPRRNVVENRIKTRAVLFDSAG